MVLHRRAASFSALCLGLLVGPLCAAPATAAPPTPGYPEPVVQWGVQKGETCDDIAKALYGSARWAVLLQRYNHVACKADAPLREGLTLVMPTTPTTLPDARLRSMNPDVRARPGGGGWAPAATGMPLFSNYNVNTLEQGRADVEFIDRTRVFLAPNTLVVIYGTASQTRVSTSAPAAVEVESGEVKAALAALRGEPVEVDVKGGGHVSATSRDTVVQRRGERTTVAVFEGKAGVTSGGKSVEVPENFGTRFVGAAPPAPPRPLPPAPVWAAGGSGSTVLVQPGDKGVYDAAWSPVPDAIQYRIEVERDREKPDGTLERQIVSRDEVPATVTAFHAEKLDLARYHLTVRAIDKEEYLGIAAERAFHFVEAKLESGPGTVTPREIDANPYGVLRLTPMKDVEMALDDGPFGPMVDVLDLRRRAPRELRLRQHGGTAVEVVPIKYSEVKATLDVVPSADQKTLAIHAQLGNVKGIDVPARVHPSARVHLADGVRTVPLAAAPDGSLTGSVAIEGTPESVRVDVVDDRGVVLGTTEYGAALSVAPPPPAPAPEETRFPQLGAYAPLWQASPSADVLWFAPTPPDGAALSVALLHGTAGWAFQGQVRASGAVGPLGLDAELRSDTTDDTTADASGWLGARFRVLRFGDSVLELSPALRVGFPASSAGMPAQLEPAVAVGGAVGRYTWLADVGARIRLEADHSMTGVPAGQGFVVAGGTMDIIPWLRLHATLDTHFVARDGGSKDAVAGAGVGVEAGGALYGGLSLHLSPWSDPGVGPFTAQLALGFRGGP